MYYNVHTHNKSKDEDVTSVYCLTESEILTGNMDEISNLYYSCGIHPWYVESTTLKVEDLFHLIKKNKKVIAVGEIGLDKLASSSYQLQVKFFEDQINLSKEVGLPLIIHCVKAWDDLIRLYKKYKPSEPWIIHGFRGNKQQAEQLQKIGFYFSLGVYFNKEVLSVLEPERVLLETDDSQESIKNRYIDVAQLWGKGLDKLIFNIEQNVSFLFKILR